MNFCSDCGHKLILAIPAGDLRERHICNQCSRIHYENPKLVVGVIAHWQDQVLLCRRGIEPQKGLWCLPAGFMENGESSDEGAMREAEEETRAQLEIESLYAVYNLPHINQTYMYYLAKLITPKVEAGLETLEAQLFKQHEIPWSQLAYPSIAAALQQFFIDQKRGQFPLIHETINSQANLLGNAS
ncbi:NUDIX hydrolase [Pseudoteredinibacter isoporae]|uniref:ADP-ribose pyrophosphatase YjhB (NUDIX family) n=1 Tax=Pseudoteredinibacter isoporae TaxID=570281 RepID=A0A7X0JS15_9GAMM|nr:NUDIX hydrolase [Pseudoteredinibacter isoporae]MBB6520739.1 ADP-ribose pyrophosphatase YjhB (NUDIX family) [Pseudoteredinibacter isoporae]NHO86306.1 NUDIX hydrolase [Pseudoteredinibacter isoporae]NIB25243.1 NUDIX hydrolase [Pseudoteredinibacter isoporae]